MRSDTRMDITGLLRRWGEGEQAALAELTPLVYEELRRLARHHLAGERQEQTLTTTALVHEAWLRLVTVKDARWQDRAHFFALCAQLMRRILVDHARARLRACRGGGAQRVSLEQAEEPLADDARRAEDGDLPCVHCLPHCTIRAVAIGCVSGSCRVGWYPHAPSVWLRIRVEGY